MADEQAQRVLSLLKQLAHQYKGYELWAHHGDCQGSDEEFHAIAHMAGFNVHTHPPHNPKLRAFCMGDHIEQTKPYKIRNGDIVRASDLLIATPHAHEKNDNQLYSGTWSTIRIARLRKVPYVIYYSDGRREGGNKWKKLLH